jgi:hypothetical protein
MVHTNIIVQIFPINIHTPICSSLGSQPCPLKHASAASALRRFLLYPVDVLPADRIPCCHVLLHALREAGCLAAGERGAGLGYAFLEAVLIDFLE